MAKLRRIGFDRAIKVDWLDAVASEMQTEKDPKKVRDYLHDLLKNEHPAYVARRKTVSVLMRIWCSIPQEQVYMRDRALQMIDKMDAQGRLLIHWGMILLAYPFFRDIVTIMSDLFALQREFSNSQVVRKLERSWGQRTTVKRAAQRVIRSLCEWGIIKETGERGVYTPSAKIENLSVDLELWFVEAVLRSESTEFVVLEQLHDMSSAFPFSLNLSITDLFKSGKFEINQQGLHKGVISVK